jgi:hypothetical protein
MGGMYHLSWFNHHKITNRRVKIAKLLITVPSSVTCLIQKYIKHLTCFRQQWPSSEVLQHYGEMFTYFACVLYISQLLTQGTFHH